MLLLLISTWIRALKQVLYRTVTESLLAALTNPSLIANKHSFLFGCMSIFLDVWLTGSSATTPLFAYDLNRLKKLVVLTNQYKKTECPWRPYDFFGGRKLAAKISL